MTGQQITIIVDNYINGNITDFKEGLSKCTKKEVLLVIVHLAEGHFLFIEDDNAYIKAIQLVDKYL